MKYFVEVISDAITDEQAAATRLAETLKLDPTKALALLRRNPVTKPVSQAEAEKVARLFRKAGIEVFVRSEIPEVSVPPVNPIPPEVKVSSPSWPEPSISSSKLPDAPIDLGLSNPNLPEVQFSSPNLPEVNISSPSWPDPKISSPNFPDVKISSSTWPDVKLSGPNLPNVSLSNPNLRSTPVQEDALKLPSSFFNGNPLEELPKESVSIPFESKYPTLPPISEAPEVATNRSGRGVGQFLLASLLPGFLAIAGIGAALYFWGLPLLRNQQHESIQNAATALASSIGSLIGSGTLDNPAFQVQLQNTVYAAQKTLFRDEKGIDFTLVTDANGTQVAGWNQKEAVAGVPDTFINALLPEIQRTISEASNPKSPPQNQLILDGELYTIATHAIRPQNEAIGAVITGIKDQKIIKKITEPSMITLVAGLIPLILSSLLFSLILGRKQS